MPLSLQAKLLRVIQDESFERIGGTKSIKVDIRIIAVTTEYKGTGKYYRKIGNSCWGKWNYFKWSSFLHKTGRWYFNLNSLKKAIKEALKACN